MIEFIKDLVEEAKVSENHTAVKQMTYSEMMDVMKNGNSSFCFENFCDEISEYIEKSGCSFSCVAEGTMRPVLTVKYHGFESDNKFNSAKFGKAYMTRDGHKALYITKESDIHKLCIENGDVSYYNADGTYNCFNELVDSDMLKQYSDYDIVAEWYEPIDEKELNILAWKNNPYEFLGYYETQDADKLHLVFSEGFKKGYLKAKSL